MTMIYRQSYASPFRLSPHFALAVLDGTSLLGAQFVLESQQRDEPNEFFCADQLELHIDPRSLPTSALRPAVEHQLAAPEGCVFLFEFICLLESKSTDPYGWQYKSDVTLQTSPTLPPLSSSSSTSSSSRTTTSPGGEEDGSSSVWTPSPSHRCTARRRVWFRVYCAAASASAARKRLSDETIGQCRGGERLRGELWKEGHLNKSWKKRFCILTDRVSLFSDTPFLLIHFDSLTSHLLSLPPLSLSRRAWITTQGCPR